ncbi:unnamed protein product [Ectocarpus sp. 12 AP-2014]
MNRLGDMSAVDAYIRLYSRWIERVGRGSDRPRDVMCSSSIFLLAQKGPHCRTAVFDGSLRMRVHKSSWLRVPVVSFFVCYVCSFASFCLVLVILAVPSPQRPPVFFTCCAFCFEVSHLMYSSFRSSSAIT